MKVRNKKKVSPLIFVQNAGYKAVSKEGHVILD